MHNGKTRMNTNERSEQTKPEAVNQQLPPSQGSAAAQPSERIQTRVTEPIMRAW
jgi:hypothetical protein